MNNLEILKDSDVFENPEDPQPESYEERQTVKVIIKNEKGEIALVTNPIHKLFLIPGGGAESNNLVKEAEREALEETNFHVKVIKEIGKMEEYRNRDAKHYITTCFLAEVIKKGEEDLRTEEEIKNGLKVEWFKENEALEILKEQTEMVKMGEAKFYNTAFNIIRDYKFLSSLISNSI